MICPKCHKEIPDGSKFCLECGSSISGMSKQSGVEADQSIGNQCTMGQPSAVSLGDQRTLMGNSPSDSGGQSTAGAPLTDRYEILEEIGRGGFAVVCRARDKKLDRIVAIKRLLVTDDAKHSQQAVERFHREAQSIAKLNHRNIVSVYDHDHDADGDYIVMEFVEGGSLRDHLKSQGGKMSVLDAVKLVKSIAQGLAYAHRKNLVHRDIKPGNILLSAGDAGVLVPKIVDFGLARAGSDSNLSHSGYGMGTPYYMAPEQRDGKEADERSDIYAVGMMLYRLLTGRRLQGRAKAVSKLVVGLSGGWDNLIDRCLEEAPADRPQTMAEVATALRQLEQDSSVQEQNEAKVRQAKPPPPQARKPIHAWRWVLLLLALGGVLWLWGVWDKGRKAQVAPSMGMTLLDEPSAPVTPGKGMTLLDEPAAPGTKSQPSPAVLPEGSKPWDEYALYDAAINGNLADVERYLKNGTAVDARNEYGLTPLRFAAVHDHLDVIKYLVAKGADVNTKDNQGYTPLMAAALNCHLDVVEFLVDKGADVNARSKTGQTALTLATDSKKQDIVEFLKQHGAGPAWEETEPVVEYLKQNGAAKESIQSVASQAIDTNNFEQVVRTMLRVDKIMKTGEKIQAMVNQKIVNVGDVISVQTNGCMHYFKVRNIDIQKQSVQFERPHSIPVDYDPFATTPVHKSTSEKPFFDPKDTVEAGVNTKDKQGSTATPPPPGFVLDGVIWSDITTPIHEAATHGNLADVERYLKNGTAVDARDKIGKTPLMEAGSLPVAAFLVNKGADVNARSTDGWTPLMLAAGNGRLDVVKYLVDKGANVNAQDKGDWTPLLSAACEGGEMDMVKYLVSKGANVNARSKTGQSALTLATDRKKQDIVEFLKQHGAKE